jgi:hypothetical protein
MADHNELKIWYKRLVLLAYVNHKNRVCVVAPKPEPTELERAIQAFCESPTP